MEYLNNIIIDVDITDTNIIVSYDNNELEKINKSFEGYGKMYVSWLLNNPVFISDIYKKQMRDITLCHLTNNITCFKDLNTFFNNNNKINVINFFNYMRKRNLNPPNKNPWNITNN